MGKYTQSICSLDRVRCVMTAFTLVCCTPLSIAYLLLVAFYTSFGNAERKKDRVPVTNASMTVMLTGGRFSKGLHLARWFWKQGYKVVMVETEKYRWCGTRWSRAVTCFEVAKSPTAYPDQYIEDLARIAKNNKVDYFVPIPSAVSAVHDSRAKPLLESLGCRVLHFDLNVMKTLDNKHEFCNYARSLGLNVPVSFCAKSNDGVRSINRKLKELVESEKEPKTYIMKSIEYDDIHRLDMFKLPCEEEKLNEYLQKISDDGNPITPQAPWQVQQYIDGPEYSCMAVLRAGNIRMITISESSASHLNFNHKHVPEIIQWVQQFAAQAPHLIGQICWDFIQDRHTKKVFPLECNPRIHSQCIVIVDKPDLVHAVLSEKWEEGSTLVPDTSTAEVFWLYNELFKLLPGSLFPWYRKSDEKFNMRRILHLIETGRESDLDLSDPAPFLLRNHLQVPILLMDTFWKNRPWVKVDFCIGKVVELGG